MTDNARKLKNDYMREYMRKWRLLNKEKVKKSNEQYWERRAKKIEMA